MIGQKGSIRFAGWLSRSVYTPQKVPAVSNNRRCVLAQHTSTTHLQHSSFQHSTGTGTGTGTCACSSMVRYNSNNSNNGKYLSPSEAGKMAFQKRLEMMKKDMEKNSSSSTTTTTASLDTILSHAGLKSSSSNPSESQCSNLNEPLCPPINFETTYTRPPSGDYNNVNEGGRGWIYARMGNPTRKTLEDVLTNLELSARDDATKKFATDGNTDNDTAVSCAFSSGMAAVSSIILALSNTKPLHIILPDDIYHGVPTQLKTIFVGGGGAGGSGSGSGSERAGVTYSAVDMTNMNDLKEEIKQRLCHLKNGNDNYNENDDGQNNNNSSGNNDIDIDSNILIWMESPSNPLCKVTDIEEVCRLVQDIRCSNANVNISTVVDSTWAPPYLTQPVRDQCCYKFKMSFCRS